MIAARLVIGLAALVVVFSAPLSQPAAADTTPTLRDAVAYLDRVLERIAANDMPAAAAEVKGFQRAWIDVEGVVKTRSPQTYTQTENDMALAYSLLTGSPPAPTEARSVIERMKIALLPFIDESRYTIFDASIILLREGLEALLVLVALSAFLVKSGNANRRVWVWSGALVGLAFSLVLGVALQLLLSSFITGGNRELIEGITGLFAAVMLLYVSYWLHSKSSLGAWQRYLGERTTTALTNGGLYGLAVLSFLAVFREGAETVLFYLGMTANIAAGDLIIGLVLGAGGLVVLGLLMTIAGLRIPMGPFFTVASVLVFYLCFKFLGTGVHALQVAGSIPSSGTTFLPRMDLFGLYPTWATTIPQMLLLLGGAVIVLRGMLARSRPSRL